MNKLGRPLLIGTTTIEKSELLATLLNEYKISYELLNARPENVKKESEIIAQAGKKGAVTIATNMAGRGTDIVLGGSEEILTFEFLKEFFKSLKNKSRTELEVKTLASELEIENYDSLNIILENYETYLTELILLTKQNIEENRQNLKLNPFYKFYTKILIQKKEHIKNDKIEILKLGGLHVIGTERHESRRIDNQLRGRSGRQGDPGSSRFFLSLDDKLLRLFGSDQILAIMKTIGFEDTIPIQSPLLNQSLESAQKKIEAYYYETRKQLFDYDQPLIMQRNGFYNERKSVLQRENVRDWIIEYAERTLYDLVLYTNETKKILNTNDFLNTKVQELLGLPFKIILFNDELNTTKTFLFLCQQFQITYNLKEIEIESIERGLMRELERTFLLQQLDFSWKEHLQKISFLKDSIRWRAYGQKDPLTEYKKEAFNFFITMLTRIRHRVIYFVLRSKIVLDN
jgi:preprotein translocase subunit SecA